MARMALRLLLVEANFCCLCIYLCILDGLTTNGFYLPEYRCCCCCCWTTGLVNVALCLRSGGYRFKNFVEISDILMITLHYLCKPTSQPANKQTNYDLPPEFISILPSPVLARNLNQFPGDRPASPQDLLARWIPSTSIQTLTEANVSR